MPESQTEATARRSRQRIENMTPEQRARRNERHKIWQRARKAKRSQEELQMIQDRDREAHLLKHYGLTLKDYDDLLRSQNGKCAICDLEEKPLHVDHDHATHAVRGLLCHRCNTGIGLLSESSATLARAIKYLAAPA